MPEQASRAARGLRAVALGAGVPLLGLVAFVVLWWAAIALFVSPASFLSGWSPTRALPRLAELLGTHGFWRHVVASLRRIAVGMTLALAVGVPLGMLVGSVRWVNHALSPATSFVRMVSPLSWTPLAIILFGVGDGPVYFLVAIGAVWPIMLNTAHGVATLERKWTLVGRSLGATPWERFLTIVWPAIRSDVLTGVRLGLTTAWIILVPAEMLGVDSGLGFFILDSRDRFDYPGVVAAILVIGAIGLLLDRVAAWALTPRRRSRRRAAPAPAAFTGGAASVLDARAGDYRI